MKYYALFYDAADDYVERRHQFLELHLSVANASVERGELQFGGTFADTLDGALLIFRAKVRTIVEEFAQNDPYAVNGLIKNWTVREWNVVIGQQYSH